MKRLHALALVATIAACTDAPKTPEVDGGTSAAPDGVPDAGTPPDAGTLLPPPEWPHPVGTWVEQVPAGGTPAFSWEAGGDRKSVV